MALNLSDRIAVIYSQTMQQRVEGSVAKYALYLLGNGASTVDQKAWALRAMDSLAAMALRVSVHVLDNPDFLAGGSDIADAQLQGAVEAAVNARFITPSA